MTYRVERLNSFLRQEISDIVQRYVKDPRLGTFVSVTTVEISKDMRYAKVFISRYGTDLEPGASPNLISVSITRWKKPPR